MDIFSFGVVLFELFAMCLISVSALTTGEPNEFREYARKVSKGYRERLKASWPQNLRVRTLPWHAPTPPLTAGERGVHTPVSLRLGSGLYAL